MTLVTREGKGSRLTTEEMDGNLLLLQKGYPEVSIADGEALQPFKTNILEDGENKTFLWPSETQPLDIINPTKSATRKIGNAALDVAILAPLRLITYPDSRFSDYVAGTTEWGEVEGNLVDQRDLKEALDKKLDTSALHTSVVLYPSNNEADVQDFYELITDLHYVDPVEITSVELGTSAEAIAQFIGPEEIGDGYHVDNLNIITIGSVAADIEDAQPIQVKFKVFLLRGASEIDVGSSAWADRVEGTNFRELNQTLTVPHFDVETGDRIIVRFYARTIGAPVIAPRLRIKLGGETPCRVLLPLPVAAIGVSWDRVTDKPAVIAAGSTKESARDSIGAEPAIGTKGSAFNKSFGNTAGTVTEGSDPRLSDSREWSESIVPQAEAEDGTATTARKWTAQRVKQAITKHIADWWTGTSVAVNKITGLGSLATISTNQNTSNFLRGDGTWATPPDNNTTYNPATTSANGLMSSTDKAKLDSMAQGANNYSHPTTEGNKHIPTGGSGGQILKWSSSGTAVWGAETDTTYSAMSVAEGTGGTATTLRTMRADYLKQIVPALVPAASATVQGKAKLGHNTVQTVAPAANPTTTASRSYWVQLNADGKMVVNVPWTAYSGMSSAEARAGTATSNRTLNAQIVAESARYHGQRGIFSLIDTDTRDVEGNPLWQKVTAPSGLVNMLNFSDLSNVSHDNCTFASGTATLGNGGGLTLYLSNFISQDGVYLAEWEQSGAINSYTSNVPITMQGNLRDGEGSMTLQFWGTGTVSNIRIYKCGNEWALAETAPHIDGPFGRMGVLPAYQNEGYRPPAFYVATPDNQPIVDVRGFLSIEDSCGVHLSYSAGINGYGGTISWDTARLSLPVNTFRFSNLRTIASKSAAGQVGDMCVDASYLYVCVANNSWKRVALSTW